MKISYDLQEDILYFLIKEGPVFDSKEIDDEIRLEYGKEDEVLGIEVMNARKNVVRVLAERIAQQIKAIS